MGPSRLGLEERPPERGDGLMGRRGRKSQYDEEGDWKSATAQRLEQRRWSQPDPSRGPKALAKARARAREMALAEDARLAAAGAAAAGSSEPFALDRAVLNVQREYYRTGAGLTATTLQPFRHTYFVWPTSAGAMSRSDSIV